MSSDEGSVRDDEIATALRIAKARQHAVKASIKKSIEDSSLSAENELKTTIKSQHERIEQLKQQLSSSELSLREANYEIARFKARLADQTSAELAPRKTEIRYKADIVRLRETLEKVESQVYTRNIFLGSQCEKISKLVLGIHRHVEQQNKFCKGGYPVVGGLLEKVRIAIIELKQQLVGGIETAQYNNGGAEELHSSSFHENAYVTGRYSIRKDRDYDEKNGYDDVNINNNDDGAPGTTTPSYKRTSLLSAIHGQTGSSSTKSEVLDNALLDMCGSLEEENARLHEHLDLLRKELDDANRESNVSKLIPHYRLGIVRSRNLIAKLQEQLAREQNTSQILREQLEATYGELQHALHVKSEERISSGSFSASSAPCHPRSTVAGESGASSYRRNTNTSPILDRNTVGDGYQRHGHHSASSSHDDYVAAPRHTPRTRSPESHTNTCTAALGAARQGFPHPDNGRSEDRSVDRASHTKFDEILHADPEIGSLDAEIDVLKEQLHRAALAQTHQIMSQVINSVKGTSNY